VNDRARLPLCDLAPLAVFLCGARWQTALARLVHRDPRLIRRYVAGGAPISAAVSERIAQLVRDKHGNQMRLTRSFYLDMIGGLSLSPFRASLLAIDLNELAIDDLLRRAALRDVA
jgi:hypothetical protein